MQPAALALVKDREGRPAQLEGLRVHRGVFGPDECAALEAELLALREMHPPVGREARMLSGSPLRRRNAPWGHGLEAFARQELPPRLARLANMLVAPEGSERLVDVTVQYYLAHGPRFGSISAHIDPPEDGDVLRIFSLGSPCVLNFYPRAQRCPLPPGELQVAMLAGNALELAGPARHRWWHGIATPRPDEDPSDRFGDARIARSGTRISVVFGSVLRP